jgi:hypothetical protein
MAKTTSTVEVAPHQKACSRCKEVKSLPEDFYQNGVKKDGSPKYASWCKPCRLSITKVRYREGNKYFLSIIDSRSKTPRAFLSYLRSKAKARKECSVTLDELEDIYNAQKGLCALTGRVMAYRPGEANVMSIDRIDPSKTYTKDNVQLVCREANVLKWNLTKDELIAICKEVVEHNG